MASSNVQDGDVSLGVQKLKWLIKTFNHRNIQHLSSNFDIVNFYAIRLLLNSAVFLISLATFPLQIKIVSEEIIVEGSGNHGDRLTIFLAVTNAVTTVNDR